MSSDWRGRHQTDPKYESFTASVDWISIESLICHSIAAEEGERVRERQTEKVIPKDRNRQAMLTHLK